MAANLLLCSSPALNHAMARAKTLEVPFIVRSAGLSSSLTQFMCGRYNMLDPTPQEAGGILPALQRLSYAGKHMEDAQRTLEQ